MRSRRTARPPITPTAQRRERWRKNQTRSRSTSMRWARASRTRTGTARDAPRRLRAQSRSRICRSSRDASTSSPRTCADSPCSRRCPRTARSCSVSEASCSSPGRPSEGSRSVALRHRSSTSSTAALPSGTARSRSSSARRTPWTGTRRAQVEAGAALLPGRQAARGAGEDPACRPCCSGRDERLRRHGGSIQLVRERGRGHPLEAEQTGVRSPPRHPRAAGPGPRRPGRRRPGSESPSSRRDVDELVGRGRPRPVHDGAHGPRRRR